MSEADRPHDASIEVPGFRIVRRLAIGGMAELWMAVQKSLDRTVVIKVASNDDEGGKSEFRLRLEREAALQAKINHRNVVTVIDRGTVGQQFYVVMEYVGGGDLRTRLNEPGRIPLDDVRRLLRELSDALSSLHQRGVIHRDIKPENVLLDDEGSVRLSDFGVAVSLDEIGMLTTVDVAVGTLDYMAPEQQHRLPVDYRVDQYAMALVAYEMIVGRRPTRLIAPPSHYRQEIPPAVDDIVLRALSYERDDRFDTLREFASSLDGALSDWQSTGDDVRAESGKNVAKEMPASRRPTADRQYAVGWLLGTVIALLALLGAAFEFGPWDASSLETSASHEFIEQTGALPFRLDQGVTQVLLVRSKSDSHWTVPKATQRKRNTLSATAVEEAFEEAGVRGRAVSRPIGQYTYKREGNWYRVTVLSVHVDEELSVWPEDWRKRQWCTVPMATDRIASDRLREIVSDFRPAGS